MKYCYHFLCFFTEISTIPSLGCLVFLRYTVQPAPHRRNGTHNPRILNYLRDRIVQLAVQLGILQSTGSRSGIGLRKKFLSKAVFSQPAVRIIRDQGGSYVQQPTLP